LTKQITALNLNEVIPKINPTKTIHVSDMKSFDEFEGKVGIYIFWDYTAMQKSARERNDINPKYPPLYIGRSNNLKNRILDHMNGNTHTSDFSIYFHSVDVYDMEVIEKQSDVKEFYNNHAGFNKFALTDLYEIYYIIRKAPFFNEQSNHYGKEWGLLNSYFTLGHYINNRRWVWANNNQKKAFKIYKKEFKPKVLNERELIEKLIEKQAHRMGDINKDKLRNNIMEEFFDKTKRSGSNYVFKLIENHVLNGFSYNDKNMSFKFPCDTVLYYSIKHLKEEL
jgi:hypothetical protein